MANEFSIKEEIRVEVKENLAGLNIDVEAVYNEVENNEFMLTVITLSIYEAIAEQLKDKNIESEEVEDKIYKLKNELLDGLVNRGVISL